MVQKKKTAKKKLRKKSNRKPIQVYAFIDTNIFLDFYRAKTEATISLLRKLEQVKDRVICTYQVEMEFLKNRQNQIQQISKNVDLNIDAQLPAVMSESQINTSLRRNNEDLRKRKKDIDSRVEKLLTDPSSHDQVYKTLEAIFNSESGHVLTRDMQIRHKIKRLAWRRFILGYPPRKDRDTSIGDALNWEWIIHCGKQLSGKFIIVSRDSDFGVINKDKGYLNDALKHEFRDRVGKKSISYTHKLSDALKALEIHVTVAEEKSEDRAIDDSRISRDKFLAYYTATLSSQQSTLREKIEAIQDFLNIYNSNIISTDDS